MSVASDMRINLTRRAIHSAVGAAARAACGAPGMATAAGV